MMKLEGKTALVTGAARGIGMRVAEEFAKEGATLILADVAEEVLFETAKELSVLGTKMFPIVADVSNYQQVVQMVSLGISKFEKIDILVNNAGVNATGPSEEFSEASWDKVIATDLKGVFLCSQAVGKAMINQKQGSIINISSIAGYNALPGRAAYCSAKAAVRMLTKVLGIEWAKYNIRVNGIAPGYVRTKMIEDMMLDGVLNETKITGRTPMARIGNPGEIGKIAIMLASEDSSYMTGTTILVDGGWVAYGYI